MLSLYRDTETIHKAAMAVVAGLSFPRLIVKGVKCLIRRGLSNRTRLSRVKRVKEKKEKKEKKEIGDWSGTGTGTRTATGENKGKEEERKGKGKSKRREKGEKGQVKEKHKEQYENHKVHREKLHNHHNIHNNSIHNCHNQQFPVSPSQSPPTPSVVMTAPKSHLPPLPPSPLFLPLSHPFPPPLHSPKDHLQQPWDVPMEKIQLPVPILTKHHEFMRQALDMVRQFNQPAPHSFPVF